MSDKLAFAALSGAEDSGYAPALRLLGTCYYAGNISVRDTKKAAELLEAAYGQGDVLAAYHLALIYSRGYGFVDEDDDKADSLFAEFVKAAESIEESEDPAYPDILAKLGLCYEYGYGVEQDDARAMELYLKAADLGSTWAMAYMGRLQDLSTAIEWYLKAAEPGNGSGLWWLGYSYHYGFDVDSDYEQAMEWYLKAAELEYPAAMCGIGKLYFGGDGVDQDYSKGMEWFLKAAKLGYSDAMLLIGSVYEDGLGVEQDYEQAMEWYLKSAELENSHAMEAIGRMYEDGLGVEQDEAKAQEWFDKQDKLDQ